MALATGLATARNNRRTGNSPSNPRSRSLPAVQFANLLLKLADRILDRFEVRVDSLDSILVLVAVFMIAITMIAVAMAMIIMVVVVVMTVAVISVAVISIIMTSIAVTVVSPLLHLMCTVP